MKSQRRDPAKPYLYIEELATLVPWSVEAIRAKVRRGTLRRGVHYFQETRRARLIFKWAAIVEVIEQTPSATAFSTPESRPRTVLDIEAATEALYRLMEEPPPGRARR